jgi:hypothetical protein
LKISGRNERLTPDEADAALTAWVKTLPHYPGRRTYLLEHIDGEWIFRRHEIELMVEEAIEEAFGLDPEPDDDRRYGFKLG